MSTASGKRTVLWVDTADCIACGACENACRLRHGVARTRRAVHGPAISFPAACRHCEEPACVEGCISGAMQRDATTGAVLHDAGGCVGCWSCIMACPFGAVSRDLRGRPVGARCDRCADYDCPACVAACTTGALKHTTAEQMPSRAARTGGAAAPLMKALLCALLPLLGLATGILVPWGEADLNHGLGKAAGGLVVLALLLPLFGRALRGRVRRARWTAMHMGLGVPVATAALAHSAGRFGLNIQTAAAATLYLMVLLGAAYRYLRPPLLTLAALFDGQLHATPDSAGTGPGMIEDSRVLHAAWDAHARGARHWTALLRRADRLLALCLPLHVVLGILAVGFIVAHVTVMTWVGAGTG